MPQSIVNEGEERMQKTVETFKRELQTVKTGRANPQLVSNLKVVYYGSEMPLNQIAALSVPEAQILMIKPYDKSALKDIEKAIYVSKLGITPQSDGTVIRLVFPPLTTETKKQLVKDVSKNAENMKVAIRNIRRDVNEELKAYEKERMISEDELKDYIEKCQKVTDKYIAKIDEAAKEKEEAIMEI